MSNKTHSKTLSIVSAAFAVSLAASNIATAQQTNANPFTMNELSSGYMQVTTEGKCGNSMKKSAKEGKCGEGKCGGSMEKSAKEGKCDEAMKKSAKEGKCGEGMNKSSKEGKCGSDMKKDMKEGKCGGM